MEKGVHEKHEVISCSRCGNSLQCKANSPWNCECNTVELNKDEIQYISELFYDGCLCARCLNELKADFNALV
ncbi:cysteine-rich CWC family protein [Pseudopedobacter beijingensis]|uniref:Cysteine-rich CWC family protein n=1 Tax=Pseudopedobacter beijingensis TaxID=1207056 RepID=A0ABW4IA55_9SPHI